MLATPWVQVDLPEVNHNDNTWGPLTAKVLWGLRSPEIWLEFPKTTCCIAVLHFKRIGQGERLVKLVSNGDGQRARRTLPPRNHPKRESQDLRVSRTIPNRSTVLERQKTQTFAGCFMRIRLFFNMGPKNTPRRCLKHFGTLWSHIMGNCLLEPSLILVAAGPSNHMGIFRNGVYLFICLFVYSFIHSFIYLFLFIYKYIKGTSVWSLSVIKQLSSYTICILTAYGNLSST